MTVSATRLTLYAIISSMEIDLRLFFASEILNQSELKDLISADLYSKFHTRARKEYQSSDAKFDDIILLDFFDFSEIIDAVSSNKNFLTTEGLRYISTISQVAYEITPIRNRVMHTRPLQDEDFAKVMDTGRSFSTTFPLIFKELANCIGKINTNPEFVFSLEIPQEAQQEKISHNLPTPDFDETGFIGRDAIAKQIKEHIYGTYPVITLTGVGGIGKTALALKVAYDIVDDDEAHFDSVVWVTSKTTTLGRSEILTIENAVSTSLGVFSSIGATLGASQEGTFDEILEYMKQFKILLILDNLETVLDNNIREFLRKLPMGSKVLITSRISVGALDLPIEMKALEEKDSIKLIRILAKTRSIDSLTKSPQSILEGYVKRMKNNPGFIKWFVTAIHMGERPEKLLVDHKLFLKFCMQNVFEHLSESAQKVLDVIISTNSMHSFSMLHYLSDIEAQELQIALHQLMTTNMINMQNKDGSTIYRLLEIPQMYLHQFHSPDKDFVALIMKKKRQIVASAEELGRSSVSHPYHSKNISLTDASYRVVVKYLSDTMKALRGDDYEQAEKLIEKAKSVEPGYFEVHRVDAMLLTAKGSFVAAKNSYDLAIEIKPDFAPLRLWYGSFLMRDYDDTEGALSQFKEGRKLDPKAIDFDIETARAHLYLKNFDEMEPLLKTLSAHEGGEHKKKLIIVSLNLQYHRRMGEYLFEQREYAECITCFYDLYNFYTGVASIYLDSKNKEQLSKAVGTLDKALHYIYHGSVYSVEDQNLLNSFRVIDRELIQRQAA